MSRDFYWEDNTPDGVKELYHWQYEQGTNFNSKIFELLGKADTANLFKLNAGWPDLVEVWLCWRESGDDYFEQYKDYISEQL